MSWERDDLLAKARLYTERGFQAPRSSAMFPFWSVLSLELLARAALAHVHPALLADPTSGDNLLHAFGFRAEAPRSVPIKTVVERLKVVVDRFTQDQAKFCMSQFQLRNEEIHTGLAVFEGLPTAAWLTRHLRVSEILLEHMGLDLSDLLPESEVDPAKELLVEADQATSNEVKAEIGKAKSGFEAMNAEAREAATRSAAPQGHVLASLCPACGHNGRVEGKAIGQSDYRLEADAEVRWEVHVLPTSFRCQVCGLELDGYERLESAGIGGHHVIEHSTDAIDFYAEMAADYWAEPDYGND